jgi:hypothetical protein
MTVNNELEMMWKEAVVAAYCKVCKVLAQCLPAGIKENHEQPQTRELVFWPRLKQALLLEPTCSE